MKIENICLGCMEDRGEQNPCPKCGWTEGTQPESPLHLKPGTILKGQYLIGRVLGHGGFGITYLACDLNLGAKLAIKEYFPQGMATRNTGDATISVYSGGTKEHFEYGLEKFIDEARTLAKFDDIPEIVTVKDFFKENGTAYLVMSYVEGITLKDYIVQNGGKLPLDAVLTIMLPVMKALEHVHQAGILHRDISPDNIYITRNFNVKLLDFGAARFAMGEHSKSLSVLLKPGYAPEEQYRTRGKQGTWTDVYAVAATMYKALTGETSPEALDRLHEDTLKRPSEMGAELPLAMEQAILKALSVIANDRFQLISDFKDALFGEEGATPVRENPRPDKRESYLEREQPAHPNERPDGESVPQARFNAPAYISLILALISIAIPVNSWMSRNYVIISGVAGIIISLFVIVKSRGLQQSNKIFKVINLTGLSCAIANIVIFFILFTVGIHVRIADPLGRILFRRLLGTTITFSCISGILLPIIAAVKCKGYKREFNHSEG